MLEFERHAKILSWLREHGHASVEELAKSCAVSLQTIRRDFVALTKSGQLVRFHGGAKLAAGNREIRYDATSFLAEKEVAARRAAQFIPDNASVFIAGGSTLALVARHLRARANLTVVTNNIHAAISLMDQSNVTTHVIGGLSRANSGSITGERAVEFISRFKVDFALIGTSGIDRDGTLLSYDQSIVSITRAMLANCRKSILVADCSKFESGGIVRGVHLRDFGMLVLDRPPPPAPIALIAACGVSVECG